MAIKQIGQPSEFDAVVQSLAHIKWIKEESHGNPQASAFHLLVLKMWRGGMNGDLADPTRLWYQLKDHVLFGTDGRIMTELLKRASIGNVSIIEKNDYLGSQTLIEDNLDVSGAVVFKTNIHVQSHYQEYILVGQYGNWTMYKISSIIQKHSESHYSTFYKNYHDRMWYLADGNSISCIMQAPILIDSPYMFVYEPVV
jgi:hypothetical protein